MRSRSLVLLAALTAASASAQSAPGARPFGTLRDQSARQQQWLQQRLDQFLPGLMRQYGIDLWVIPMREYNEDPLFRALVSPTTFAARRRTIYVFYDRGPALGVERLALGGTSQGGVYEAVRTTKSIPGPAGVGGRTAELWGDEQWTVLKKVIEERNPRVIGINRSRTFAFADGLSSGELEGMTEVLGPALAAKFKPVEGLAVDLLALRLADEEAFYRDLQQLVWAQIEEMFSARTITPGVTRTSDLVWWWRQRITDLGLETWFQPSVSVQRQGWTAERLGEDPIIERGDVIWCDVGVTALGLNTDTQHNAYVLRTGETTVPAGLQQALRNSNRLQDLLFEETAPGRSGNDILFRVLAKMRAEGLNGTVYSHPIGLHGHGAGSLIGLWDYQEGVPGRGDHTVTGSMWFSSELQVTTPVAEWGGQPVRIAQEEDFSIGADGRARWVHRRQAQFWLVK
jgi:hypothetical protein